MEGITYDDLKNCAALAREAKNMQTLLGWYREMASCPTPATQGIPVQSGPPSPDRMGEWMDKIGEMSERLVQTIDAYMEHVLEVDIAIAGVDNSDQRTILRLRYLEGLTWDVISERTHYSVTWCKEMLNRGISHMNLKECLEVSGDCVIY